MPRVAAVEHPFGRPYGAAGDAETQRAVLEEALTVFTKAREPGHVEHLRTRWPDDPTERKTWHPSVPSPAIALMLKRRASEAG